MESKTAYVRISNGKRSIYKARLYLLQNGFDFHERAYGKSFYQKEVTDKEEKEWVRYAKWHGYTIHAIPKEYTRSSDYRGTFFKNNNPSAFGYYRCAYCGKRISRKDTTVDHIFPVNRLSYSQKARAMAKRYGIHGANEEKNLVAACRTCNSKKGTKMGIWIYQGFIGKSEILWRIRLFVRWMCWCIFAAWTAAMISFYFW